VVKSVVTDYLASIVILTDALWCSDISCHNHRDQIEQYYGDIVNCLKIADKLFPRTRVGFHKHWWTPELDAMKQQCIDNTVSGVHGPLLVPLEARIASKVTYWSGRETTTTDRYDDI